jgi:hypothetical protein
MADLESIVNWQAEQVRTAFAKAMWPVSAQ